MRNLVRSLAVGRIVVGAALLAKPEEAARGWIGQRAASYSGTQTAVRAFGARDLSLGAGALAALMAGRDARDWVAAGAFADLADLTATATAEDLPLGGRVMVLAMASAAIAVSAGYLLGDSDSAG
jgi:hypothetical protein